MIWLRWYHQTLSGLRWSWRNSTEAPNRRSATRSLYRAIFSSFIIVKTEGSLNFSCWFYSMARKLVSIKLFRDPIRVTNNHPQKVTNDAVRIFTICNALQCHLIPTADLTQSIDNESAWWRIEPKIFAAFRCFENRA